MKPTIDTSKRADNLGSSSSQPSPADRRLGRLRKELKRERKRERENVRFIDGWEQYKTLSDGIEFKRAGRSGRWDSSFGGRWIN